MASRDTVPLHQYESFRIVVLRVIESFVHKSLDETISLLKITTVINNNPLLQLVRTQISPDKTIETLPKVTIRDVILSITKIFQSSDIQILANNDNFKIKLSRPDFQALIDKHYGRYQENAIDSIRDDEEDYEKVMKEISMIEKGELDQLVVQEYKQSLPVQLNKPVQQQQAAEQQPIQRQQQQSNPISQQQQRQAQAQNQQIPQSQLPEKDQSPQSQSQPQEQQRIHPLEQQPVQQNFQSVEAQTKQQSQQQQEKPVVNEEKASTPVVPELSNEVPKIPIQPVVEVKREEVKAPTPEATTPTADEEEDIKKDEDKKDTNEENEEEEEKQDDESSAGSRKRRSSKAIEEKETPAKKRAKIASSSVPSSPGGPVHAPPNKKLQILSNPLIANITSYKYASTFLQPVSESNAPDYYSLIKEPRDLKTIRQMVKDGRIQNAAELEREILLMFANAIMYNKDGTDIYNWSKEMQSETDNLLQLFKESYDTT